MARNRKTKKPVNTGKIVFAVTSVFIVLAAGFLVGRYGMKTLASNRAKSLFDELYGVYQASVYVEENATATLNDPTSTFPASYLERFRDLYIKNKDVAGWLTIEGAGVYFPIVQGEDNEYYKTRNFLGKQEGFGTPYFDAETSLEKSQNSTNKIVWLDGDAEGHITAELRKYLDTSYYRKNPVIDLATVYEAGQWKVISAFITSENDLNYYDYHSFLNEEELSFYIDEIRKRSAFDTRVNIAFGDELVTISAPTVDFEGARLVIVARKIRTNEVEFNEAATASPNQFALQCDEWYSTFGGQKPLAEQMLNAKQVMTTDNNQGGSDSSFMENNPPPDYTPDSSEATSSAESFEPSSQEPSSSDASSEKPSSETSSEDSSKTSSTDSTVTSSDPSSRPSSSSNDSSETVSIIWPPVTSAPTSSDDSSETVSIIWPPVTSAPTSSDDSSETVSIIWPPPTTSSRPSSSSNPSSAPSSSSDDSSDTTSIAPPPTSSAPTSSEDTSSEDTSSEDTSSSGDSGSQMGALANQMLSVYENGVLVTDTAYNIVCQIVANEMNSSCPDEALKAQAVAAHTFVVFHNNMNWIPDVGLRTPSERIKNLVKEVIEEMVYYNGKPIYAAYFSTSAGYTNTAGEVWGGTNYPYTQMVESKYDYLVPNYKVVKQYTYQYVRDKIKSELGISLTGDPSTWFEVVLKTNAGYNSLVSVGGQTTYTKSNGSTAKITGTLLRGIFSLRSNHFDIVYKNDGGQVFEITTLGYGHGVGMSQYGAIQYATIEGWNYKQILNHYYTGVEVR